MPYPNSAKTTFLIRQYENGDTFHIALISSLVLQTTISAINTTTNFLTFSGGIMPVNSSRVRLFSTGALPKNNLNNITNNTDLLVAGLSGSTFQLTDLSGNIIDWVDVGTGTITLVRQALIENDSLASKIQTEVSNVNYTARQVWVPLGQELIDGKIYQKPNLIFIPVPLAPRIEYRYVQLIRNGSAVPLNTSGAQDAFFDAGSTIALNPPGSNINISVRL